MDLFVVSFVVRNVNYSFILRIGFVRSLMVRVCWVVLLDGKGYNVIKVKV